MLTCRTITTGLAVVGFCCASLAAAAPAEKRVLGTKLDDFTLADAYGQQHRLSDYAKSPVVVLAILGAECPLARLYAPRLQALAEKYQSAGVAFLGINSNAQDNITELKNYARVHGVAFPILKDLGNTLADRLRAERTPTVYVLDGDRVVRYQGRIDDQYGLQPGEGGKKQTWEEMCYGWFEICLADQDLSGKVATSTSGGKKGEE